MGKYLSQMKHDPSVVCSYTCCDSCDQVHSTEKRDGLREMKHWRKCISECIKTPNGFIFETSLERNDPGMQNKCHFKCHTLCLLAEKGCLTMGNGTPEDHHPDKGNIAPKRNLKTSEEGDKYRRLKSFALELTECNIVKLLHHRLMLKEVGTNQAEANALNLGLKEKVKTNTKNIRELRDWLKVKSQMALKIEYLEKE